LKVDVFSGLINSITWLSTEKMTVGISGNSPEFLCDLIPSSVRETNNYNLRNSHNISQTTNILSISQQSFFPSTTKLWNLLDLRIRQLSTFESFKYKLKQHYYKNAKPPSYYNIGNRYLNILHTNVLE
jgi:hypothetical protein